MSSVYTVHDVVKDIEIKKRTHEDSDGNFDFTVYTIKAISSSFSGDDTQHHEIKFFVKDKNKAIRFLST
tara:strand:- start:1251 stop:1457 length:207 start_codon:yes stop_codon:yes gene_type:complete